MNRRDLIKRLAMGSVATVPGVAVPVPVQELADFGGSNELRVLEAAIEAMGGGIRMERISSESGRLATQLRAPESDRLCAQVSLKPADPSTVCIDMSGVQTPLQITSVEQCRSGIAAAMLLLSLNQNALLTNGLARLEAMRPFTRLASSVCALPIQIDATAGVVASKQVICAALRKIPDGLVAVGAVITSGESDRSRLLLDASMAAFGLQAGRSEPFWIGDLIGSGRDGVLVYWAAVVPMHLER